jgi:hypothetical protein
MISRVIVEVIALILKVRIRVIIPVVIVMDVI